MAHPLLWGPQLPARLDGFAAVIKNVIEELEIVTFKLIALLFRVASREWRLTAQPLLHASTTTLNHMPKQLLPFPLLLQGRVKKTEQRAEALLDAAVRSGCDKDHVTRSVLCKIA